MGKGALLPQIPDHQQQLFQQCPCFGMEQIVILALFIILPRGCVGVLVAQIDPAGRHAVADHLADIAQGHFHAAQAGFVGRVVDPVFQMVLVAALMVKPGAAVALYRALHLIGAAVPLIVFGAGDEFDRGIFGKVVRQPLPIKAYLEAVLSDKGPMMVNRFEMLEPFCH